jgi:23S rRNA pseudouridine955/2504/2580 synthase
MSERIVFKELIIYEDENCMVINKPAHISSLHERFDSEKLSIIEMVKKHHPDYALCHRIDRETSGALLIAKNQDAYKHFALQFEHRTIKKVYHAVVNASVDLKNLNIDLPLYTDSKRRVQVSKKKGKESITIFDTYIQFKHYTVLACQPLTGRLHQIRVHAASQNLPLICDELYGGKIPELKSIKNKIKSGENDGSKPIMSRVALHAFSIEFNNLNGEMVRVEAPYPKDFSVLIKLLNKYDTI